MNLYMQGGMIMSNKNPIIRHISSPTPAGCLAVLVGDGFVSEDMELLLTPCSDHEKGLPSENLTPENIYVEETYVAAEVISIAEEHTITFKVPGGQYRAWIAQVKNSLGESNRYVFNVAQPKWLSSDKVSAGKILRIFGEGLIGIDAYSKGAPDEPVSYGGYVDAHKAAVVIKDGFGKYRELQIMKASSYDIHVKIPEDMNTGVYEIYVHNGYGGRLGWSKPLTIEIVEEIQWPQTVFNVLDYGAKPVDYLDVLAEDNIDNTPAFQAALDAAEQNGGGIVFVPIGRYRFYGSLRIPRYTVLKGEDPKRVWFELPKGVYGEDGWGTPEEGMQIKTFIIGEGDFGIENLNILAVYSPIIIGAPVHKELPELGEEKFRRYYGFGNLIDHTRDADNVFIRNCHVVQEPSYFSQRKTNEDPSFKDEKWDGQHRESKLHHWAAVAIKGRNIEITDCDIKGGGAAVVLMGAQNSRIANNTLYSGSYSSQITMFSSSYNSQQPWHRINKNIIIEDNELYIATNLNRSAFWIMEGHINYYVARNYVAPLFWHSDCEGICFHMWGGNYLLNVEKCNHDVIKVQDDSVKQMYSVATASRHVFEETGKMKAGRLKGWECIIVRGKGLGQYRTITDNTEDSIILDQPWDTEPDETSVLCVCEYPKFHNTYMIDNITNEGGRALYYWGNAFESVIDGNVARRNSGVLMEDLSRQYPDHTWWQCAGHFFNKILHNKASEGQGFSSNIGVIGVSGGQVAGSTVSMIIRDNVAENDVMLTARPLKEAPDGLNYYGVVLENNISRNSKVGIWLGKNVEAVLKDNVFENVDEHVVGEGEYTKVV